MFTSPLPIRSTSPRHRIPEDIAQKAADFESLARLVEDLIPSFKKKKERQFYREVVQSYRTAAQKTLGKSVVR